MTLPWLSHPATANSPVGRKREKNTRRRKLREATSPSAPASSARRQQPGPCPSAATASSPGKKRLADWRFHLGAPAPAPAHSPTRGCGGIRSHAMPRGELVASDGAEDAAYLLGHIADCGLSTPALYDLRLLAEREVTESPARGGSPASPGGVPATTGVDGVSNTVHPCTVLAVGSDTFGPDRARTR